jgi:hypothetical protein
MCILLYVKSAHTRVLTAVRRSYTSVRSAHTRVLYVRCEHLSVYARCLRACVSVCQMLTSMSKYTDGQYEHASICQYVSKMLTSMRVRMPDAYLTRM